VREHLRAALPDQPGLPAIARRLFLSPRTLHRRLEDEGTSFRAIKDGLRRELATEWLTKTRRPLGRIGADLGFADAAAFYRAFTAWTGSGPRDYRQRHGAPARHPGDPPEQLNAPPVRPSSLAATKFPVLL
jgi:AraC-like DNA-binding protein